MCELDFDRLLAPVINPIDHKTSAGHLQYILQTPEIFFDVINQRHASLVNYVDPFNQYCHDGLYECSCLSIQSHPGCMSFKI